MSDRLAGPPGRMRRDDNHGSLVVSHTFAYLLARGVPGVVAFLAIPVFTNLLEPGEYGSYALTVTAINVANSLLFQWICLAMVRCFPTEPARKARFTSTIAVLWLGTAGAVGLVVAVGLTLPFGRPLGAVLILGWAVLAAQSMFDIVTELLRASLRPWHFMVLQLIRASSLVGLGSVLLHVGVGWTSPLIAVAVGMAVAVAWRWRSDWRDARLRADRELAGAMFRYGAPVSLTVALAGVIFLCDRSLVAILLGNDAAGLYSVAFDFTSQSITLVMMAVSMAAFPIAVRELETRGVEAARQPMATNAALLLAVGVPTTVGAGVLAPGIAGSFFGDGYAASADIIPLVALSALLAGLKAYHFDAALQFARRTAQQVWIVLAAAVVSVLLNLLLIPIWGLRGAAFSSVVTFLVALVLTAWWGRRHFPLPFPIRELVLVVLASAAMGAALFPFRSHANVLVLATQVVAGAFLYGAILVAVDCFGLRRRTAEALWRSCRPGRSRPTAPTSRHEGKFRHMTGSDVCVYSPYAFGGHPRYVAELLSALAEQPGDGPSVEWVSSIDLDPRFRSDRYVVHAVLPALRKRSEFRTSIGWAFSRSLYYCRREWRFLAWLRTRPNIGAVHLQETSLAITHLVVRCLKKRGMAVFITVHNVRPHTYPSFLPRSIVDRSLRRAYSQSDCLFVHSTGLAAELDRFLRRPVKAAGSPRIRVVHHGIWTVGGESTVDDEVIARRLQERRLLCFGAIRRNKGIHLLLEAAARGELDGYRITVAGPPLEQEYLEGTVLPLVDRARVAGVPVELSAEFVPDEDIASLFDAHSALVLPYTEEFVAQSGTVFMALAHGLPVVATSVGGLAELMSKYRIGVTVREPTARALTEAIHGLFSATEPDIASFVNGIQSAIGEMGWSGMAAATAAEYRRVGTTWRSAGSPALFAEDANCST
jgi:O-antigen/teichoic acid export membrane protein/glycosyltransferase involved in cell wall biosynthesis